MTFEEYQKLSRSTAKYPKITSDCVYPIIGLCGEAGEVANKVKKIFRDDNMILTDSRKEEINHELGDLLWYVAQLATDLGIKLEDVAQSNLEKLNIRMENGKISGDGDNR